jgi:IS5 family transposase
VAAAPCGGIIAHPHQNAGDVTQTEHLLHGEEKLVFADAGYTGVDKRPELKDKVVKWVVAAKRGLLKAMPERPERDRLKALETAEAQIRSLVEHPFHVIKNRFGYRKVRYRGLAKNTAQLFSLFALVNLVQTKDRLLAHGVIAP